MQILVATDFSVRSDRAMRRAALLARKLRAQLTLVHVIDNDQPRSSIAAERMAASDLLDEFARTMREADGIETDWLVQVGRIHSGILEAADESSADLIVVGPHRNRWRDVLVGITAERIIRESTRPLLVAADIPASWYRNTLLALGFDEASVFAAQKAHAMGVFSRTDVIVMHAFDAPAESHLKRAFVSPASIAEYVQGERISADVVLSRMLEDLDLPPSSKMLRRVKGSPARTIVEAAQQIDSDLIVVGTNRPNGLRRSLIGSVADDVLRDARHDVLVIPDSPPFQSIDLSNSQIRNKVPLSAHHN